MDTGAIQALFYWEFVTNIKIQNRAEYYDFIIRSGFEPT